VYQGLKGLGHFGHWPFGRDTQSPGVYSAQQKVGDKFMSEDRSRDSRKTMNSWRLQRPSPSGRHLTELHQAQESCRRGDIEYTYFVKGIGVVREVPEGGDVLLTSHEAYIQAH